MPKKKRNLGMSPSRKNRNSETIPAAAAGVVPSPADFAMSQPSHGISKEDLFSSFSEMFSDLDPTVVYMVLSECDFRGKSKSLILSALAFHGYMLLLKIPYTLEFFFYGFEQICLLV